MDSLALPYLDDELESDARADIEAHLAGCADCSAHVHQESAFREAFRARAKAAMNPAPDSLRARIRSGIRTERRRANAVRWVQAGAAAAAVVAVAGGYQWNAQQRNKAQVADALAFKHQRPYQLDMTGRLESIQNAASGHLMRRVRLDFPNASLEGVRFIDFNSRDAVLAAYEGPEGHKLSVFAFDDPDVPQQVELANQRGYNVATWRENETAYALVTDLDESDIRELLRARAMPRRRPAAVNLPSSPPASFMASMPGNVNFQQASFQQR